MTRDATTTQMALIGQVSLGHEFDDKALATGKASPTKTIILSNAALARGGATPINNNNNYANSDRELHKVFPVTPHH